MNDGGLLAFQLHKKSHRANGDAKAIETVVKGFKFKSFLHNNDKHSKIEDQKPAMDWQNQKSVFIGNTRWRVSNCCVTYFLFPTETGKNQSEPNSLMWPTAEDPLTYYAVARRGNYSSGRSSAKLCRTQNLLNIEDWPTGCHNITGSNWLIYGGEISRDMRF